jgi:hypothetical protein
MVGSREERALCLPGLDQDHTGVLAELTQEWPHPAISSGLSSLVFSGREAELPQIWPGSASMNRQSVDSPYPCYLPLQASALLFTTRTVLGSSP